MTASRSIANVKTESRWIGLHASQIRKSWMKNELTATITMSATQIHPAVRCGSVPLGALSCIAPSAKAAMAVKACSWMAGSAFNSGASDTTVLPMDLSYRLDQFERHHGGAGRDLAAAKPDTKRASVCE